MENICLLQIAQNSYQEIALFYNLYHTANMFSTYWPIRIIAATLTLMDTINTFLVPDCSTSLTFYTHIIV